jgi:hypothetical protein
MIGIENLRKLVFKGNEGDVPPLEVGTAHFIEVVAELIEAAFEFATLFLDEGQQAPEVTTRNFESSHGILQKECPPS